ncbi:MAG: hypothetical protein DMG40_26860 [Acidobacteria bacterium]|nr:MAG: hypothetical protein DMG40_26860 [Acidobacteriota bacterium]
MVSKSSNLANQNFRLKTRTPRRRLPLPSIFKGLALDSLSCSPAAESPQTSVLNLATYASPASCDHANATSGWALQEEALPFLGRFFKRFLDLLLASIALVLLWPLMLVIAIAVSLESPRGPVIFASLRVGKRGVLFSCYKFRTMIPGANGLRRKLRHLNQRRGPFFKIADDPRVTRLGRFLRKYSLDELPQLWNVLKGDMSLVGPRPHPVEDVAQYGPGHEQRLEVTPGITGLWQITARQDPSFETCMLLDVGYIRRWSLLLDFKILLRTIPAVLAGEGL